MSVPHKALFLTLTFSNVKKRAGTRISIKPLTLPSKLGNKSCGEYSWKPSDFSSMPSTDFHTCSFLMMSFGFGGAVGGGGNVLVVAVVGK